MASRGSSSLKGEVLKGVLYSHVHSSRLTPFPSRMSVRQLWDPGMSEGTSFRGANAAERAA